MSTEGIQLLDTSVIHQLRSSLTITTLPQCLKELINNAIDAKSTSIDILIDIEKFSLQVNDNGFGIPNMSKIGKRHVTSKCHTLSDISQLKTFGFRGEALASITNESMVQIISRHYLEKDTFEGFWRDGRIVGDISHSKHTRKNQPGTSIIVRDLFYKFPVRRRHLTSTAYQHVVMMESVKRLIMNFALCFHNINFTLVDNARNTKILMVKRSNSSLDVFRQLFGQDMTKYTKPLDMHEDNIWVDGFFSTRGYPNKAYQYIYINNFFVPNDNELYKIVSELFSSSNFIKSLIEHEQDSTLKGKARTSSIQKYPIYLIKFACPDWSYYEINMYLEMLTEFAPFHRISSLLKKFTIKFLQLSSLLVGEKRNTSEKRSRSSIAPSDSISVRKASSSRYLEHSPSLSGSAYYGSNNRSVKSSSSRTTDITEEEQSSNFVTYWDSNLEKMFYIDPRTGNSYLSPPTTTKRENSHTQNTIDRSHLKKAKLNQGESKKGHTRTPSKISSYQKDNLFSNTTTVLDIPHKLSKADLQNARVLGQVDNKYIVIKLNQTSSLVMIDQHAADERVKLEEMLKQSSLSPTTLEPSICLEFDSPYEYQIITNDRILKYLKIWGIHIVVTTTISNDISEVQQKQDIDDDNASMMLSRSRFFSTAELSPHFVSNDEQQQPSKKRRSNYLNRVYVTQLPQLIIDRCIMNHTLLKDLIRDYAYWLKEQKDDNLLHNTCPKGIMEMLKSKACRSAIMFNDSLTLEQCQKIVGKLANCNFPFQCAHGRPSVVPINIDANSMYRPDRWPNWDNNKFKKQ